MAFRGVENVDREISTEDIVGSYRITARMIAETQKEIIKAFHRFL